MSTHIKYTHRHRWDYTQVEERKETVAEYVAGTMAWKDADAADGNDLEQLERMVTALKWTLSNLIQLLADRAQLSMQEIGELCTNLSGWREERRMMNRCEESHELIQE